jgi:quinol monooxygenase YgiN
MAAGESMVREQRPDGITAPHLGGSVLAKLVKIKPEMRQSLLDTIEVDALGSEQDEPGCVRFNVLQNADDESVYYFFEVSVDAAAVDAHRAAPHYAVWRAAADTLDSAIELIDCQPVFPSDPEYWTGR